MSRKLDKTQRKDNVECAGVPARNQFFVLADQVRKFRKDERGSIIIFSLFIFIMMLMIGGLALDVMRAEYQRTTIQYTSDRAVLAAASLKQTVSPQDVIDDYFAKAGIVGFTPTATMEIDEDNLRKVVVEYPDGPPKIKTMFMNMVGLHTLDTPAQASAVDGVEKVEISLVLDVSGSMGSHSRLVNLKVAAKEFVDTILLEQPEDDTYSISIVPFATQVSAGQNLLSKYNATSEHNYSHCVDFDGSDFNSAAISPAQELQRTGHFAPFSSIGGYSYRVKLVNWQHRPCAPKAEREIIPLSGDNVALKNYIDGFQASGNTSTDIGIKWGAALLDPSARPVVSSLIEDNDIEDKFAGRPFDYGEEGVLKVIVVMTDGHNTNQYYLNSEFSSGLSNVWLMHDYRGRDRYAIRQDRDPSTTADDRWAHSYRESTSRQHWKSYPEHDGMEARQLTYPELWNHATIRYVASYLQRPADYNGHDYTYWRYGTYGVVGPSTKDTRMNNICSAAKANNVLIFTIGFEVTNSNATKLQNCATTAAHFFRVEGVEISEAFSSIAAQLNSLRLVK